MPEERAPVAKLFVFTDSDLFFEYTVAHAGIPREAIVRLSSGDHLREEIARQGANPDYQPVIDEFAFHVNELPRRTRGKNAAILIDGHTLPMAEPRYYLVELLRQKIPSCPVIVVATHFYQTKRRAAFEAGVSILISAGFDESELLDSIAAAENDWRASGKYALSSAEVRDRRKSMWVSAAAAVIGIGSLVVSIVALSAPPPNVSMQSATVAQLPTTQVAMQEQWSVACERLDGNESMARYRIQITNHNASAPISCKIIDCPLSYPPSAIPDGQMLEIGPGTTYERDVMVQLPLADEPQMRQFCVQGPGSEAEAFTVVSVDLD